MADPDPPAALQGACHCGAVTFSTTAPAGRAVACTCSLCRRRGALWAPAREHEFTLLSGEEALTCYQFGTRTARHYFCRHCGTQAFARPRIDPSIWVVNLRCIDAVDLTRLGVDVFDGANWEAAAQALRAARAARPPDAGRA